MGIYWTECGTDGEEDVSSAWSTPVGGNSKVELPSNLLNGKTIDDLRNVWYHFYPDDPRNDTIEDIINPQNIRTLVRHQCQFAGTKLRAAGVTDIVDYDQIIANVIKEHYIDNNHDKVLLAPWGTVDVYNNICGGFRVWSAKGGDDSLNGYAICVPNDVILTYDEIADFLEAHHYDYCRETDVIVNGSDIPNAKPKVVSIVPTANDVTITYYTYSRLGEMLPVLNPKVWIRRTHKITIKKFEANGKLYKLPQFYQFAREINDHFTFSIPELDGVYNYASLTSVECHTADETIAKFQTIENILQAWNIDHIPVTPLVKSLKRKIDSGIVKVRH